MRWLAHLQWGWVVVGVSLMGASWTAETVPSVTWGPTWTTTIYYKPLPLPKAKTIRLPPDPAKVRALIMEMEALCDKTSRTREAKEACRMNAQRESARWR